MQKENNILRNEIKTLKGSVKILNDERVKDDCIISGVKTNDGEKALDKLLEISTGAGVNLSENEVKDAYFLKKRSNSSNNKQTMIVKFESNKSKAKMMQIKKKLKENEDTKSIFINDFLSKETLNVFKHAKSLKSVGYQSVYTYNGKVYIKRSEISKPRLVRSEEEVDELLMDATTNKFQKRRSYLVPAMVSDVANNNNDEDDDDDHSFLSPS